MMIDLMREDIQARENRNIKNEAENNFNANYFSILIFWTQDTAFKQF